MSRNTKSDNNSLVGLQDPTNKQRIEFQDIDAFMKDGFKTLVDATRHGNALPKDRDYDFYNTHQSFREITNAQGNHILGLINKIMHRNEVEANIKSHGADEKVELIVEANDLILERAANVIDEMNGLRNLPKEPVIQTVSAELPVNGSWNNINKFSVNADIKSAEISNRSISLLTAKNIVRPQKFFKDKIENSSKYPWKPRITEKPNSLKPLALYIEETEQGDAFCNPYEFELDRFVPSDQFLKQCTPAQPKPVDETPLHEVTTVEQLDDMLQDLYKQTEIAVDLEHHSYRTFMGITCLMQISTKDADYIVDTLALRDKLHVLNEVFTKNSIIKIFHGADSDIQWLQRDLSLYVVNMFDTHRAAKQLEYSGLSLAYLLNKFCSVMSNKKFQLADWRIRPLPDQLKEYAREDTHYLIYIYHILKNELLKQGNGNDNVLKSVFQASTDVCKKIYIKPQWTETSHLDFYRKCKRMFDNRQMYALKQLYQWRDHLAREEDESTGYILPNHMLLQISEMLPREVQGILACCNPIPPLVRANVVELHQIILRARDQPLEKTILKEDVRGGTSKETIRLNVDSALHCPHDLTKQSEFRDDLPTLLGNSLTAINLDVNKNVVIEQVQSKYSIFNDSDEKKSPKKISSLKFLGPYERYKLIKPFILAEEEKAKEAEKEAADALAAKEAESADKDPSVAERIASLQEHTIKEAELVASRDAPAGVSDHINFSSKHHTLTDMGGRKKRKREQSASDEYHPHYKVPNNNLHTPVPSTNSHHRSNTPNKKHNNKQEDDNQDRNQNQKGRKRCRGGRGGHGDRGGRGGGGHGDRGGRGGRVGGGHGDRGGRGGRGGGPPNKKSRKEFKPYDYTNVDYSQFQGGSVKKEQTQFKTQFRGKGKKNTRGKSNNKSFTFGNSRGRGR